MSDIETRTTSEGEFLFRTEFENFDLIIDAVGDEGPGARDALVATYASCFQGACRVAGKQRGHADLGKIQTDASAEVDDDEHLEAIHFSIRVEADLDDDELAEILTRARDICHVHDALRIELKAEIEIQGDAF